MNIDEMLLQMKSVLPEWMSSYCIVNGNTMPLDEIERMEYREFYRRSKLYMPLKLYKFFPNTIKEEEGKPINYSQLALINNTVFMQSPNEFDDVYDSDISIEYSDYEDLRLREYCNRCSIITSENASSQELITILARRFKDTYSETGSFKNAFTKSPGSEIEELSNESFSLSLQLEINKVNNWNQAISNIIVSDYNYLVSRLKQTFRVACFTTSPYSQLMWGASYANFHKGFCLEYTVLPNDEQYQEVYYNLFPMIYCKSRSDMTQKLGQFQDQPITEEMLWNIYLHGALRKSLDWTYQNEWRLLLPLNNKENSNSFNKKFFPITKVFLGNRMPAENRKEIIDICKQRNIPYVGVTRNPNMFEMRDCKILCEDCPRFKNGI